MICAHESSSVFTRIFFKTPVNASTRVRFYFSPTYGRKESNTVRVESGKLTRSKDARVAPIRAGDLAEYVGSLQLFPTVDGNPFWMLKGRCLNKRKLQDAPDRHDLLTGLIGGNGWNLHHPLLFAN